MSATLVVFVKECRESLRDKRVLLNALILGPLIGPLLFVILLRFTIGRQLQQAEQPLPVVVIGAERAPNLVAALQYARQEGARIGGIVGRAEGYTAQVADVCIVVPCVNGAHVTPHAEAFQAVIWHALVSHPSLKTAATKW